MLIGERFFVSPSASETPVPPGRMRLIVYAQSAFGSGRHESTQLMIQALESLLHRCMTVLDIGCGSGILAAVARQVDGVALVAGSADAVDTASADLLLANTVPESLARSRPISIESQNQMAESLLPASSATAYRAALTPKAFLKIQNGKLGSAAVTHTDRPTNQPWSSPAHMVVPGNPRAIVKIVKTGP